MKKPQTPLRLARTIAALLAGLVAASAPAQTFDISTIQGWGKTNAWIANHPRTPAQTYTVTSLANSGSGTLRDALTGSHSRPLKVVFNVGGEIKLQSSIAVSNGDIWIDGSTAPSPGITLRKPFTGGSNPKGTWAGTLITGFSSNATDMLFTHLRFRPGSTYINGGDGNGRGAIWSGARTVFAWCTFSYGTDVSLTIWQNPGPVTIHECLFHHPLSRNNHNQNLGHGYWFAVNEPPNDSQKINSKISIHRCIAAHGDGRFGLFRGTELDMFNNIVYDWGSTERPTIFLHASTSGQTTAECIGNLFLRGPTSREIDPVAAETELSSGAIYMSGNYDNALRDFRNFPTGSDGLLYTGPSLRTNAWNFSGLTRPTQVNATAALWDALKNRVGCRLPVHSAIDQAVLADIQNTIDKTSGVGTEGSKIDGVDIGEEPVDKNLSLISNPRMFETLYGISGWNEAAALPEITTTALPAGRTTVSYGNQQLAATGGTTPYSWSLASGTLPAGLSLGGSGIINGTPTTAGTSNFTVLVTDAASQTDTQALSITINTNSVPAITTAALSSGSINVAYNQNVESTGGDVALAWSVLTGSLPAGLSLGNINNQTATISGTPTSSGTSNFTLELQDVDSDSDTQALTLEIVNPSAATVDTFEDGSANGWTADGGTWSVVTNGTKVYRQSDNGTTAVRSVLDATNAWTDQSIEADVNLASVSGTNRFFGVVARYGDAGNYYYFVLRTNNTIELKKLTGGSPTTLASAAFTVSTGTWYTLRLEVIGTALKAYVNNDLKLQATDSQHASGKAGLLTQFTSVDFDNVTATPGILDTFEDGNANGWTADGGTWSVVTNGTKVYRQSDNGTTAVRSVLDATNAWTDQSIEADISLGSVSGTNRFFGVVARYGSASNYYYFVLRTNNTIELKKLTGGSPTTLASAAFTVSTDTWYTLKLEVIGTALKAYINDVLELQATDSQHTSGKAGLLTQFTSVDFDNVNANSGN